MKIAEVYLKGKKDPGMLDFMDSVMNILNQGRYSLRVVSGVPAWTGEDGDMVMYASETSRGIYFYINGQWNKSEFAQFSGQALIHLGTGNSVINGDTDNGFWVGNAYFGSAPFRVSMTGALTATSATISGIITATSGTIGGFTIGATALTAGSGATAVGLAPATYPFYAGNVTAASAPFRITPAGAVTCANITAIGGTISGWTLLSSTLYSGSGSSYVGIDAGPYPFWAGSETPTLAPFYVTNTGTVHASSIVISGLQAGSEVDGSYLKIGTVAANKIIVSELSAISSVLGTVTAGTITAGTVQTSADPAVSRVKMDPTGLVGYDAALGLTFKLPTDGSAPVFASGIIQSATIVDTTFISNNFQTSSELPYLDLTSAGLAYVETTAVGKYGSGVQYGDGTKYGTGFAGYFGNSSKPMLSIESERALADIRLYNRALTPIGPAVAGDLVCVGGKLKICTSSGTPGTWAVVGDQTAGSSPSKTPSHTPSHTPSPSATSSYTPSHTPSHTASHTPSATPEP